jgi:endonuclease-3 related protein
VPRSSLRAFHRALSEHYGPLGWWPGETPFEVMVGAVLTQNTAWTNVEQAISRLRDADALSLPAIDAMRQARLARLIRPAGYFNVKARRLKNLVQAVQRDFGGDLGRMFDTPTGPLRRWLLDVNGVGEETADSILCYAGGHAVLVVDTYTRRILSRHGLVSEDIGYAELQAFCTRRLPRALSTYNEFHAQLVYLAKDHCRPRPRCEGCPLEHFPHS